MIFFLCAAIDPKYTLEENVWRNAYHTYRMGISSRRQTCLSFLAWSLLQIMIHRKHFARKRTTHRGLANLPVDLTSISFLVSSIPQCLFHRNVSGRKRTTHRGLANLPVGMHLFSFLVSSLVQRIVQRYISGQTRTTHRGLTNFSVDLKLYFSWCRHDSAV